MANIRFTCENEKGIKSCKTSMRDFQLGNMKGVICEFCYGVDSYEIETALKLEKPKKEKITKTPVVQLPEIGEKSVVAKTVEAKIVALEDVEESTTETLAVWIDEPVTEKSKLPDPVADGKKLLEEGKQIVEILQMLKENHGMTGGEAAQFYKANFKAKEKNPDTFAEAINKEAQTFSVLLSEINPRERNELTKRPQKRIFSNETQLTYPVTKVEFMNEETSYKFFLMTEDALEFSIIVKARPDKFAVGLANPNKFNGAKIKLKFSKMDPTEIPVNPTLVGFVLAD